MADLLKLLLLGILAWILLCITAIAGFITFCLYPFIAYWMYVSEGLRDFDPHQPEMWIDYGNGGDLW